MNRDAAAPLAWSLGLVFAAVAACSSRGGIKAGSASDASADQAAGELPDQGLPALPDTRTAGEALPDRPVDLPGDLKVALPDLSASKCGNGMMDPDEECDDGNTISGDGCSYACKVDSIWIPGCPPETGCVDVCGNAIMIAPETCDDGNITSGDGCSSNCTVEPGFLCRTPGRRCLPICGDGLRKGGETCDDGNTASGDGCSAYCTTEPGWDCSSGICVRVGSADGGQGIDGGGSVCGDGIVSGGEECDDGVNDSSYGGCTSECKLGPRCGDGIINGYESCDEGADNGKGCGCSSRCQWLGIMCRRRRRRPLRRSVAALRPRNRRHLAGGSGLP